MTKSLPILFLLLFAFVIPLAAEETAGTHDAKAQTFQKGNTTLSLRIAKISGDTYLLADFQNKHQQIAPEDLKVTLRRIGNRYETITFAPFENGLRSQQTISKPHSFTAQVVLDIDNKKYNWQWEKHEGRTKIDTTYSEKAGVTVATAQGGEIERHVEVYGLLTIPPQKQASVNARFPGIVEALLADVGQAVAKGDKLARIQSNDSLQSYTVSAPISGKIVSRNVNIGQLTGSAPIYTIIDTSTLWAELKIFPSQRKEVAVGMPVHILKEGMRQNSSILSIVPSVNDQPYQIALVEISNKDGHLTPGDLITGVLDVQRVLVPVRVEKQAVQKLDGKPVVFINEGEVYQASPVELGISDDRFIQIEKGLDVAQKYVLENSYLIKADIEKSGASHAH
ncbi:HlyD family efflux transporter periplasmic adaptor subunit [Alteromonas pelagimontana]|uniref:HlyD family efflux transporter periplasmic adaptor subunit n=1 Tax=Alteromonas pelagimontana TaxID=1858656 RepID=A0A6M4M9R8_9ALTE|nr:efflux RND transporter periplasmic adaptor subunit [Alteromonas pelagimontana]QJR79410.1 HlyD family efflux transporter periplasmic adaptor subunit [Alteromonas pelagimontana]